MRILPPFYGFFNNKTKSKYKVFVCFRWISINSTDTIRIKNKCKITILNGFTFYKFEFLLFFRLNKLHAIFTIIMMVSDVAGSIVVYDMRDGVTRAKNKLHVKLMQSIR